jgi:Na+/citrate or Na+/malate symporter
MESKAGRYQSVFIVAHDLANKLAVIVGHCDLLREITEEGTDYAKRLALIRDTAEAAAKDLREHQQKIEVEMRKSGMWHSAHQKTPEKTAMSSNPRYTTHSK